MPALIFGQPVFHEVQIQLLVATVEFVAHDGMTVMREVNADLMFPAGMRYHSKQREITLRSREPALGVKRRLRRHAVGADAILDGNTALIVFTERRIDQAVF